MMTTHENRAMLLSRIFPPSPEQKNDQLKKSFAIFFAKRLKAIRNTRKLTQEEVAERSGTHLTYIGQLERGKYRPTLFVVWKIAQALNVNIDEFIQGFSPKK
jgi:DNA-binding XRE family transcriptional regulator